MDHESESNTHINKSISPRKTCQRHLETKAGKVWHLVNSNQSSFNETLLVFIDFFTVNTHHT